MSFLSDAYLAICGAPFQCRRRGRPRPEPNTSCCTYNIALVSLRAHSKPSHERVVLTAALLIPTHTTLIKFFEGGLITLFPSLSPLNYSLFTLSDDSETHETFVHCDRLPPTACLPARLVLAAQCARACARRTPDTPDGRRNGLKSSACSSLPKRPEIREFFKQSPLNWLVEYNWLFEYMLDKLPNHGWLCSRGQVHMMSAQGWGRG